MLLVHSSILALSIFFSSFDKLTTSDFDLLRSTSLTSHHPSVMGHHPVQQSTLHSFFPPLLRKKKVLLDALFTTNLVIGLLSTQSFIHPFLYIHWDLLTRKNSLTSSIFPANASSAMKCRLFQLKSNSRKFVIFSKTDLN